MNACMHTYIHTYRSRDEKTREEVPETDEEGHNNGSNLMVWCESYSHHAIKSEVDEAHENEVVEPEELVSLCLEPNH